MAQEEEISDLSSFDLMEFDLDDLPDFLVGVDSNRGLEGNEI